MRVSKNPYRNTPEWVSYTNMIQRCKKPRAYSHHYIYDKGIKVHESWLGKRGFINFLACVGRRPKNMVLSRLDRNGDYKPGNLRWMSWNEFNSRRPTPFQRRNKTHKHYRLEPQPTLGYNNA